MLKLGLTHVPLKQLLLGFVVLGCLSLGSTNPAFALNPIEQSPTRDVQNRLAAISAKLDASTARPLSLELETLLEARSLSREQLGEGLRLLGHAYFLMGDSKRARQALDQAMNALGPRLELVERRLEIDRQEGNLSNLAEDLALACALAPTHYPFRIERAEVLRQQGALEPSKALFKTLAREYPRRIDPQLGLGAIARENGDVDAAVEAYQLVWILLPRERSLDSNFERALVQLLGDLESNRGRTAAALTWWRRLALDASPPEVALSIASAQFKLGRNEDALSTLAALGNRFESSSPSLDTRGRAALLSARVALALDREAEAITSWKQVPDQAAPGIIREAAIALSARKEWSSASMLFGRLVAIGTPLDRVTSRHYLECLAATQDAALRDRARTAVARHGRSILTAPVIHALR